MFGIFNKAPKLDVLIDRNVVDIILYPPAVRGLDEPTSDPVLQGEVVLVNERPITISSICVSFQGHQDVCAGQGAPTESSVCLRKELDIQLADEELQPGEHRWQWSFIVPSTTAPFQRCAFGRTRHFVEATAIKPGLLSSNIVARSEPIYLLTNPYPIGSPPEGQEVTIQDVLDDLGPVGISFQSNHLSIAAPVFVDFVLLHPPAGLQLLSVKAIVVQNFEITYKSGKTVIPASQKHTIFELDASQRPGGSGGVIPTAQRTASLARLGDALERQGQPLAFADAIEQPTPGKEWHYRRVARIPMEDKVRPSTLESTETALRVQHGLAGEIRYRLTGQDEAPKVVTMISKAVKIVSCSCRFDDLVLPSYERDGPAAKTGRHEPQCQCSVDFQKLLDTDYLPLAAFTRQASQSLAGSDRLDSHNGTSAGQTPHWGSVTVRVERKVAADNQLDQRFEAFATFVHPDEQFDLAALHPEL